ncbi:methyltransferase domain-containing protein [Streptomyces rimosus]
MPLTAENLRARCAEEMSHHPRGFNGCGWLRDAFLTVPREHFVPDRVWWPARGEDGRYRLYDRVRQPRAWLKAVYLPGVPLITQIDDGSVAPTGPADGAFTSSISAPGAVVELLRHLAPEPGHTVLEIGTGTGYTTALLAHRAGADHVTTLEIDARLAHHARTRLHALGLRPHAITGDGEHGHPPRAPYDRILATASVRTVPPAWLDQLCPGGLLLAPLDTPFGHDLLLRLEADGPGQAHGRFVAPVEFMRTRAQRTPRPYADLGWPPDATRDQWQHLHVTVGPAGQRIRHALAP